MVVLLATASDQYWQQMGTITSEEDYNHTSETGRLQIWSRGIGYMLQNPLLGLGPANFPAAEGTLSPFAERQQWGIGVRWNAAHNAFLQVMTVAPVIPDSADGHRSLLSVPQPAHEARYDEPHDQDQDDPAQPREVAGEPVRERHS